MMRGGLNMTIHLTKLMSKYLDYIVSDNLTYYMIHNRRDAAEMLIKRSMTCNPEFWHYYISDQI